MQDYGIDRDGPISFDDDADQVNVPNHPCPITEEQYRHLQSTISPLDTSEDYGIELYNAAVELVRNNY